MHETLQKTVKHIRLAHLYRKMMEIQHNETEKRILSDRRGKSLQKSQHPSFTSFKIKVSQIFRSFCCCCFFDYALCDPLKMTL